MISNKQLNRRWIEGTKVAYRAGLISKRQLEGVLKSKKKPRPDED